MNSSRLDMHVHTSEVSLCGRIPAAKMVSLYTDAGYDGVVVTDHYYAGFFESFVALSWRAKVDRFLRGYYRAAEAGRRLGLVVLLGAEIRFSDSPNDYLVYGLDPELLHAHRRLYDLGLEEFRQLAEEHNLMVYQAHPFRAGMHLVDPWLLDGIEVFNGNPRHDSHNDQAWALARQENLRMISGSDFHQLEDLAQGGVVFDEEIPDNDALVSALRGQRIRQLLGLSLRR